MRKERKVIRLALLDRNEGQLDWLPKNPRQWTQTDIDNTAASIERDTDFLEDRPLLVVADGDRYCVFAGNLRREGCLQCGQTEAPCVEYFPVTDDDRETVCRRAMLDNGSFGKFDWDELANDPVWERLATPEYGIPVWQASTQEDIEKEIDGMIVEQGNGIGQSESGARSFTFTYRQGEAEIVAAYVQENGKEKLQAEILELCRDAEVR